MLKFLFGILTDPLGLPIDAIWEYLILAVIGAIAFVIALELNMEEAKEMLTKAGFALSHSNKFDVIIEYFITHGNYNIFEINDII